MMFDLVSIVLEGREFHLVMVQTRMRKGREMGKVNVLTLVFEKIYPLIKFLKTELNSDSTIFGGKEHLLTGRTRGEFYERLSTGNVHLCA